MQIQKNNYIQFTGVGVIGKVKSKDLNKLVSFISDPENQQKISILEKSYSSDVFLNTTASVITLKHKEFGYLTKFGMDRVSVSNFVKHFDNVLEHCTKAIDSAELKNLNIRSGLILLFFKIKEHEITPCSFI